MTHINRFRKLAVAIGYPRTPQGNRILDFGCGSGTAVAAARDKGLQVFGCDIALRPDSSNTDLIETGILRTIDLDPYRIPFQDAEFDLVLSDQVFEHVQNYEDALREIRRVLKPGGISIHSFPSRYTPIEPHVFVPLATVVRSRTWLSIWAHLGIRNREFQSKLSAVEAVEENHDFLLTKTNYLKKSDLERKFNQFFPVTLFVEREYLAAGERYGPLLSRVPFVPTLFGSFVQRVVALA